MTKKGKKRVRNNVFLIVVVVGTFSFVKDDNAYEGHDDDAFQSEWKNQCFFDGFCKPQVFNDLKRESSFSIGRENTSVF